MPFFSPKVDRQLSILIGFQAEFSVYVQGQREGYEGWLYLSTFRNSWFSLHVECWHSTFLLEEEIGILLHDVTEMLVCLSWLGGFNG